MNKYSDRDIEVAKEIGGLTKAIQAIDDKISSYVKNSEIHTKAMWTRIDSHSEKILQHHGAIKWIIGIGFGISCAVSAITYWITKT